MKNVPPASPFPTLRAVAAQAGVSAMTVSRALGNRAGIAAGTRARIARIAAKLGYRPDPEITKLMHHVRSRQRPRFQSVLCGLTTRPPGFEEPYTVALIAGARRRAEELGHGFMLQHVAPGLERGKGVQTMLSSRGVQGVLLLPQQQPVDLSGLLDWREFAVVAATTSVMAPAVNRVTPDHFSNAVLLCRELSARGYRRIGFVTSGAHDLRVKHVFDAAVIWHGLRQGGTLVPPLVLPALTDGALLAWFRRERPDVVVGSNSEEMDWITRTLGRGERRRLALACMTTAGFPARDLSGIDERPYAVGVAVVDLLAGMVARRILGLPDSPTATTVSGIWRSGSSCPPRSAA
jgi:DNA-binding LacI/PurR family transcriptional regulator